MKGAYGNGLLRLFRTDPGWRHTLDHGAIHILTERDAITADEWHAPVRAARRDTDLMARVAKTYPELTPRADRGGRWGG